MKFFIFDLLATFFSRLESWAGEMYNHTNLCHTCGKPAYYSKPCIGGTQS